MKMLKRFFSGLFADEKNKTSGGEEAHRKPTESDFALYEKLKEQDQAGFIRQISSLSDEEIKNKVICLQTLIAEGLGCHASYGRIDVLYQLDIARKILKSRQNFGDEGYLENGF